MASPSLTRTRPAEGFLYSSYPRWHLLLLYQHCIISNHIEEISGRNMTKRTALCIICARHELIRTARFYESRVQRTSEATDIWQHAATAACRNGITSMHLHHFHRLLTAKPHRHDHSLFRGFRPLFSEMSTGLDAIW